MDGIHLLHRCIKNILYMQKICRTTDDRQSPADHRKGIFKSTVKLGRTKEGKKSEQDWTCTLGGEGTEQRSALYNGAIVWDRGKAFEVIGECSCRSVTLQME